MGLLNKWMVAGSAILLLAACETASTQDGMAGGEGYGGANSGYAADGSIIPGTQADLETNGGDRVFYALDSSVINADAQRTLEAQAAWLKQYGDVNVVVEGHADERGPREYNLALGERRAKAAKNYLVSLGIAPARVSTITYGKERRAVIGHNENAWSQNRRAVTVIVE